MLRCVSEEKFLHINNFFIIVLPQPKGVVDTIKSESEIYGNTGDNLKPLSNAVVGIMSVVSNIVNGIVDVSCFNFINYYSLINLISTRRRLEIFSHL